MTTDIRLNDGTAQYMGEGVFVLCQRDEHGTPQSVTLTREDLERLLRTGEA